jgi:pimeloyl-ACP methyl ester carboxylesterase
MALNQPSTGLRLLPDGRALGFTQSGNPGAPPVVYCHGWPGSGDEVTLLRDPPAWLIAPDRPGHGRSTPHAGGLLDWARDVAALADALGIGRFRVAGVSGGAPYALALASALPARVAAVALVNPVPPPGTVAASDGAVRHLFRLGRHPRLAAVVLGAARLGVRSRLARHAHRLARFLPESDGAALTPATTTLLLSAWRHGLRPGIAGALHDALLLARPWGFALQSIAAPVLVWQGGQDSIVPPGCAEAFRAIPHARIEIVPDAGHYALPLSHGRAILVALASAG